MRLQWANARNSGFVVCLVIATLGAPLWGNICAASSDLSAVVEVAEHPVIDQSETFTEDVVSEIPKLHVTDTVTTSTGFTVSAVADSSPFHLHAASSATGAGGEALASFASDIVFTDNQALRDLIPAGASALNLLVHFHALLDMNATVGLALAHVFAVVDTGSLIFPPPVSGDQTITGSTLENTGFFQGLPRTGGEASGAIPISISPDRLRARVSASVSADASNFTFGHQFISSVIDFSVPDTQESITLLDGTPASQHGIEATFLPILSSSPAVPEPSTWLLLGSGLVGMILWRRKRTA